MKVKIESNGTPAGTFITDTETGKHLAFVKELTIKIDPSGQQCTITMLDVPSVFEGEAELLLATKLSAADIRNMIRGARGEAIQDDDIESIECPSTLMKIYQKTLENKGMLRDSRKLAEECSGVATVLKTEEKKND